MIMNTGTKKLQIKIGPNHFDLKFLSVKLQHTLWSVGWLIHQSTVLPTNNRHSQNFTCPEDDQGNMRSIDSPSFFASSSLISTKSNSSQQGDCVGCTAAWVTDCPINPRASDFPDFLQTFSYVSDLVYFAFIDQDGENTHSRQKLWWVTVKDLSCFSSFYFYQYYLLTKSLPLWEIRFFHLTKKLNYVRSIFQIDHN